LKSSLKTSYKTQAWAPAPSTIEQVERKMKSDSGNLINRSANYVPVLSGKKDHYGLQEVTGYELHTGPSTRVRDLLSGNKATWGAPVAAADKAPTPKLTGLSSLPPASPPLIPLKTPPLKAKSPPKTTAEPPPVPLEAMDLGATTQPKGHWAKAKGELVFQPKEGATTTLPNAVHSDQHKHFLNGVQAKVDAEANPSEDFNWQDRVVADMNAERAANPGVDLSADYIVPTTGLQHYGLNDDPAALQISNMSMRDEYVELNERRAARGLDLMSSAQTRVFMEDRTDREGSEVRRDLAAMEPLFEDQYGEYKEPATWKGEIPAIEQRLAELKANRAQRIKDAVDTQCARPVPGQETWTQSQLVLKYATGDEEKVQVWENSKGKPNIEQVTYGSKPKTTPPVLKNNHFHVHTKDYKDYLHPVDTRMAVSGGEIDQGQKQDAAPSEIPMSAADRIQKLTSDTETMHTHYAGYEANRDIRYRPHMNTNASDTTADTKTSGS